MCAEHKGDGDPDSDNTARGDNAPFDTDETIDTGRSKLSDPELISGKIIGEKYKICSHLGSGAMGAVYEGLHIELNKRVAIKVLLSEALQDPIKKKRFLREAKAQGGLNHRNVAAVHDFGLTEKDQPYFVMDFLQGETLEDFILANKSLKCDEFINIFEQVARGLQHAHSKGIVHRDLKPSNIMLINSDEDDEKQALLVDFGIAVENEKQQTKLTKVGYIVGTPCYMSPEQIEGKELDARSDIYSLGCVMFEALSGYLPFAGVNAAATMALHLTQPPEHLSSFKTKSPLPPELADMVMKCLEKKPDKRYSTAKEIAAQLNSIKSSSQKQSAGDPLVAAGKGHENKNPAPSASKISEPKSENVIPAQSKEADVKLEEKIKLVASEEDKEVVAKENKESKRSRETNESTELSGETKLEPQKEDQVKIHSSGPDTSTHEIEKPTVKPPKADGFWNAPFADGHDIIALAIPAVIGLLNLPMNGHLGIPLDAHEMRDDNPFFVAAKFFVGWYNEIANDRGWQWILWFALMALIYKIVRHFLRTGHTD